MVLTVRECKMLRKLVRENWYDCMDKLADHEDDFDEEELRTAAALMDKFVDMRAS